MGEEEYYNDDDRAVPQKTAAPAARTTNPEDEEEPGEHVERAPQPRTTQQADISATIGWDAPEFEERERTNDWYWGLGVITLLSVGVSIYLSNILFAVIILISAISLLLYAVKKPMIVHYEANARGIRVNNSTYAYVSLDSFWITMHTDKPKLLIKSQKKLMPHIVIPLSEEVDDEALRQLLMRHILEEEQEEPLAEMLMERLGL